MADGHPPRSCARPSRARRAQSCITLPPPSVQRVIHGTIDENVHLQNTLQLVLALQKAGRMDFEMMLYPGNRHGVSDPEQRKHLNALMLEFIRRNL